MACAHSIREKSRPIWTLCIVTTFGNTLIASIPQLTPMALPMMLLAGSSEAYTLLNVPPVATRITSPLMAETYNSPVDQFRYGGKPTGIGQHDFVVSQDTNSYESAADQFRFGGRPTGIGQDNNVMTKDANSFANSVDQFRFGGRPTGIGQDNNVMTKDANSFANPTDQFRFGGKPTGLGQVLVSAKDAAAYADEANNFRFGSQPTSVGMPGGWEGKVAPAKPQQAPGATAPAEEVAEEAAEPVAA